MRIPITFEGGGEGHIESLSGERMVLDSSRAFAPGSPVAMRAQIGDEGLALLAKTSGSKRTEDGTFTVDVRVINFSKVQRTKVEAALAVES